MAAPRKWLSWRRLCTFLVLVSIHRVSAVIPNAPTTTTATVPFLSDEKALAAGMKVLSHLMSCLHSHTSPTQIRTLMAPLIDLSDSVCHNDTDDTSPTTTATTTTAPPPYQCYSCQSGGIHFWQTPECPADGNIHGWALATESCDAPCVTVINRWPLGDVTRRCSSHFHYNNAGIVPRNGCFSYMDSVHCFCTGDACNGGDMTDMVAEFLEETTAR